MKTAYKIALAIVVIAIIIGSLSAYIFLARSAKLAAATINGAGGTLVYPLMTV